MWIKTPQGKLVNTAQVVEVSLEANTKVDNKGNWLVKDYEVTARLNGLDEHGYGIWMTIAKFVDKKEAQAYYDALAMKLEASEIQPIELSF